ncbi:hypothetical protein MTO96_043042, partial [Rhipicephalus appendiculatus]
QRRSGQHQASSLSGFSKDGTAATGLLVPSNTLIEIDRPATEKLPH